MKGGTTVLLCLFVALVYGQNNNDGTWDDWGEPSDCSRTCGGGVSHRTRKCHHGIPGVSRGCQGDDIRYESCNTQPCPEGLDSFRKVQCSRFNTRQTTWLPHEDDEDLNSRCSLVCRESRTGRTQLLQERVVDGTECDTPENFGICVGGVCQRVGCDRTLGSTEKEDKCLVCGGREESCQTIAGSVTGDELPAGERDVVAIPLGATSIILREMADSPSMVLYGRDARAVYLDTRQRASSEDQVLRVAGADLMMRSSTSSSGRTTLSLMGRGPINDTVLVKLPSDRDQQVSMEYEYSVSTNRVLESNPNQPFGWIYGAWTSCSKECGDGYQLRAVSCIDRSTGGSVDDSQCVQDDKPAPRQTCNIKPCGTDRSWYRWVPGHWGECSVRCGVGEQQQEMYCVETGPSGDTVYVKEELCERYGQKPPVYKRACEGDGDECPYWATTAWSQCSVTCGYGTQTRQVICQRDPSDPTSVPLTLDDSECNMEQPDTTMVCRLDPCADGTNAHGMVEVEDDNDCQMSEFGCCDDGITAATGESGEGCRATTPAANACLLEPERGPCSDYSIQWHYLPGEGICRRFWYGGCQGNGNRFPDEQACLDKCLQKDSATEKPTRGDCRARVHGCCADGVTAARGPNREGCPELASSSTDCRRSRYGCCSDGVTAASGPNRQGCSDNTDDSDNHNNDNDEDDNLVVGDGDRDRDCQRSRYGCCADGVTAAGGPNQAGCEDVQLQKKCEQSYYGCCPNSDVAASGPNQEGCDTAGVSVFDPAVCAQGQDRGTCTDYSVKWYYDSVAARCKRFWYGGCGGNGNVFDDEEKCKQGCIEATTTSPCQLPAEPGPCKARHRRFFYNAKLGKCQLFYYGGCKGNTNRFRSMAECHVSCHSTGRPSGDNVDTRIGNGETGDDGTHGGDNESDRGNEILPSSQVEQCRQTAYGCCQDGVTVAAGPNYRGCPPACQSSTYGCCEDGVTPAQGLNKEGCIEGEEGSGVEGDCDDTPFGCCPDGVTAASGPNNRGCPVTTTTTTTTTPAPTTTTTTAAPSGVARCSAPSERGPCSDYSVKWFYDTGRQECKQFWYGGCQGNDNRFDNRDECEAECIATETPTTEDPDFVSICDMPRDTGPCRARLPRWHYDPLDRQCRTFYWSGCQGNENNFVSLQECQQTCMGIVPTAAPTTTTTTTTPAPYTFNPPPVTSSLEMTGDERLQEGSELRLTCVAKGPSVPTEIEWFINGKRIGREHDSLSIRSYRTPSEHKLTSELVISNSRKSNTATYYCRSIPYSDVQRKTVVVSKTEVRTTTTEAPMVKPETPDREASTPETVCRQPALTGNCRGYFLRWHYDMDTQSCSQFVFGGCNGNSNNFDSEQACLDYCRSDDDTTDTAGPSETDESEASEPEEVCRLPAVTGNCRANLPRWYYDASYDICRQFVYGGCRGNSNNFETEQDCLNFCSRDESGPDSGTRPDTGTPDTQDSNDPNVVCQLPEQRGRCRANMVRYYYNAEQGRCLSFSYGGCDGNSNNFDTEQACNDFCRADEICRQPKVVGPCRAGITRYYYDTASSMCRQFIYGGCQGNLNNFASVEACQQRCAQQDSSGTTRSKEVCMLNPDAGTCRGYNVSWYYDSSVGRCQRFAYTGCEGNGNRFATERECLDFCGSDVDTVFTPAPTEPSGNVCTLPNERGECSDYEIFWYYDAEREYCTRFYYGGCGGNGNRFTSREECEERCVEREPQGPVTTRAPPPRRRACSYSRYGCCPDGITPAIDAFRTNCRDDSVIVRPSGDGNIVLANRGSMAILDCYSPGSAIYWYRDGYYLTSDSRFQIHGNGTLVIKDIADDITGNYACRISNGNNIPQVQRYELKLKDEPLPENRVPLSILQTPPTIRLAPGDNAYLHCQAFGTPTPSVSWAYQGSPLYSGGRFVLFNNGTLMVSTATQRDAGSYTCTAQNGVDTPVSRDMELIIAQKLVARIKSHGGVAMEGDTARLRCEATGYPTPTITWSKNGVDVTSSYNGKAYVQGNTLVIPQVGIDDAGVYTCRATNDMGTARALTYLQVKLQNHRDRCVNSMSKMKCHLIVSARLCGHRMFARKCCQSCRQAGLLYRRK